MCFILKTTAKRRPKPQIAKEDIVVYKVIGKTGFGPYFGLVINNEDEGYKPGNWYIETTPFIGWEKEWSYWDDEYTGYEFNGNCFHSCVTIERANNLINEALWPHNRENYRLVKMIIPKGAQYYKDDREYVSSEIIYPYSQRDI